MPMDAVSASWWDATREQRLLLQHCSACQSVQHYPRAICLACGRCDRLGWVDTLGLATLDSYTVVHRAATSELAVPYVVARVRLAEGPMLLTNLVGEFIGDAAYDQPLHLRWRALPDGRQLPVFAVGVDKHKDEEL